MKTIGSRAQVWHGTAKKTQGGLTKKDLFKRKGRIKSKRASKKAKRNNNLKKAGWTFKKGQFGAVKIGEKSEKKSKKKSSKKKSKKQKGGDALRKDEKPRKEEVKKIKEIFKGRVPGTLGSIPATKGK